MKKFNNPLVFKIASSTLIVGVTSYLLIKLTNLSDFFSLYNFILFLVGFTITIFFIVTEYIKNTFIEKEWFSKAMSFFADLMLVSFVLAILYICVPSNKTTYLVTLMTLPFYSGFKALYTNKYHSFLSRFAQARLVQEINHAKAMKASSERAIILREEKEQRLKRIESRRIARLQRKTKK